jgi:hypothetical protein
MTHKIAQRKFYQSQLCPSRLRIHSNPTASKDKSQELRLFHHSFLSSSQVSTHDRMVAAGNEERVERSNVCHHAVNDTFALLLNRRLRHGHGQEATIVRVLWQRNNARAVFTSTKGNRNHQVSCIARMFVPSRELQKQYKGIVLHLLSCLLINIYHGNPRAVLERDKHGIINVRSVAQATKTMHSLKRRFCPDSLAGFFCGWSPFSR